MACKRCGSYAINPRQHGRDDTDLDLCDVCYWRSRADRFSPGPMAYAAHRFGEWGGISRDRKETEAWIRQRNDFALESFYLWLGPVPLYTKLEEKP